MKALNRRLMRIEGYMGVGGEVPEPIFFSVVDTSVPDPDEPAQPFPFAPELLSAYKGRLEGDLQVIKRQPNESIEALEARCAKTAPHIALWMPVHSTQ